MTVATKPIGATGEVLILEPNGESSRRSIEAPSCAEVVDALALVMALSIDPRATFARATAPEPQPVPAATSPETPPAVERSPAARWHLGATAQAMLATGFAPGALIALAPSLTASRRYGPRLTLHLAHGPSRSFQATSGAARFGFTSGLLDLCPAGWRWSKTLTLFPCLAAELGGIRAVGVETAETHRVWARWQAGGAAGLLSWTPRDRLTVELRGAAVSPLARDRFVIGQETVHQLPDVAVRGGIGLGCSFW